MLKRLSAFKKGIKVDRRISDFQLKDAHYLFPNEQADPVKNAFFNRNYIEEKCEKLRFKISPASEREHKLATDYLSKLGHNAHRLNLHDMPADLKGQNKLRLQFKEPKLTLHQRTAFSDYDYTTKYSDITMRMESDPLESLRRGKISTYLPAEISDEITMIKHLTDLENTFDKTNYIAELADNEVLVGNLPLSFEFSTFKTKDFHSFLSNGKAERFTLIKDIFNQPAILKVHFPSADAAKEFAEAVHGKAYNHSTLQAFTNDPAAIESEAYENRTVHFSGFDRDISQNEILATVSGFARVMDIHYPVAYDFSRSVYSSDVREFVEKNRQFLPPDIQIVMREFDGQNEIDIVVYEGSKMKESDFKFAIDDLSLDDVDGYTFEKHASLRQIENKHFVNKIIREQNTVVLNTITDRMKIKFKESQPSNTTSKFKDQNLANLENLSGDEIKKVIENLLRTEKRPAQSNVICPFHTDNPFQAKATGLGWCLVTFPTVHEARKAIYGMQFESQFDKLKIELHAAKNFFEYFDALNYKMYMAIVTNQQKRINLVEEEKLRIQNQVIEENVGEYYEKRLGHTRTGDKPEVGLAMGSKLGDSDVNRIRDMDTIEKAKARQTLEDKMRQYMNTFVVNEKFSRSENLQSNLAGFEKIDDVMQMRGRKFEAMDEQTGMHILKKRIQKTGETYELEQNKETLKFMSGLKKVLGSDIEKNPTEVADILDNLSLEYGFTTDETSTFRSLLEKKRTTPKLNKANYSTLLSEEIGQNVAVKPQIDTKKFSARKQMFEHLNKLARSFSTGQNLPTPDYLELYQKYYKILESKLNGDFFKTRQFNDYLIDNYLLKREK